MDNLKVEEVGKSFRLSLRERDREMGVAIGKVRHRLELELESLMEEETVLSREEAMVAIEEGMESYWELW